MTHPIMHYTMVRIKKTVSYLSHVYTIHINTHLMFRSSILDMEYFIISHQHTIAIRTHRLWQIDSISENKTKIR